MSRFDMWSAEAYGNTKLSALQPGVDELTCTAATSNQALRAEVVRRQAALLTPEPGSEEATMDPSIRQARLRCV